MAVPRTLFSLNTSKKWVVPLASATVFTIFGRLRSRARPLPVLAPALSGKALLCAAVSSIPSDVGQQLVAWGEQRFALRVQRSEGRHKIADRDVGLRGVLSFRAMVGLATGRFIHYKP